MQQSGMTKCARSSKRSLDGKDAQEGGRKRVKEGGVAHDEKRVRRKFDPNGDLTSRRLRAMIVMQRERVKLADMLLMATMLEEEEEEMEGEEGKGREEEQVEEVECMEVVRRDEGRGVDGNEKFIEWSGVSGEVDEGMFEMNMLNFEELFSKNTAVKDGLSCLFSGADM